MNCLECRQYRVEQHIRPQIGVCSAVDSQLGCEKCKTFSPIVEWKHCGAGQIKCPECRRQQTIPQVDDWRHGCCTIVPLTAEVVVPFRGMCQCVNAEPVKKAESGKRKAESHPVAKVKSRSLFE